MARFNFHTARLYCRLLDETDRADYCALYTNQRVMRKIATPVTNEEAQRQFNNVLRCNARVLAGDTPRHMAWGIFENNDSFCGIQGFTWDTETPDEVEIGLMLPQVASGKRIPFEGGGALVDYGIRVMGLKAIHAYFSPENIPIYRLLKKLGFSIAEQQVLRHGSENQHGVMTPTLWQSSPNPVSAVPNIQTTENNKQNNGTRNQFATG